MNNRTSFALLALLTAVGTLTMSSAYAQMDIPQACVGCTMEDARKLANDMLLDDIPISVWTDRTEYGHSDMIMVKGKVANVASGFSVAVTVVNPLNSIVTIGQINVAQDGSFGTLLNTAGAMWKHDGTYIIKVNYGSSEKSNSVRVELSDDVMTTPTTTTTDTPQPPRDSSQCGPGELSANDQCIPFTIVGGSVVGTTLNSGENGSILIRIDATDNGTLTLTPSDETMEDIFNAKILNHTTFSFFHFL